MHATPGTDDISIMNMGAMVKRDRKEIKENTRI